MKKMFVFKKDGKEFSDDMNVILYNSKPVCTSHLFEVGSARVRIKSNVVVNAEGSLYFKSKVLKPEENLFCDGYGVKLDGNNNSAVVYFNIADGKENDKRYIRNAICDVLNEVALDTDHYIIDEE